ncbi:FecCD family ABC transporter permease [Pseudonocardia cypriaca]|uniref:Iron complex transport system permease protein n=1 Tax=Pseudonocardia cypriaca TaxID=882449 RepID=A0A543GH26_9PSEU|nr:iron ABC transporter permease [Pseudonocardia cypriaca]TQM45353.1 iron complex transport system permease protein [Pseudonocardia cypriaca]
MTRRRALLAGTGAVAVVLFVLAVALGPVSVPPADTVRVLAGATPSDPRWSVLIGTVRLPRALTAVLVGAALGVAGALVQTLFRNPLADPYVLGVSSGAGLGVALSLAAVGGASFTEGLAGVGRLGAVGAAALGAAAVLGLVLVLARWVRSVVTLLVVGVMVGAATTAVVSLVLVWSDPRIAQQFVVWGLGSVDGTSRADLAVLAPVVAAGLAVAAFSVKPLNALLLGEAHARSVGVPVRRLRAMVVLAVALLGGGVTAFCGPIAFVGIAVPHLARLLVDTSDHRVLLPVAALVGAAVVLACVVAGHPPGTEVVVPLNVVTSLVGAPVVIAVLLRSRRFAVAVS